MASEVKKPSKPLLRRIVESEMFHNYCHNLPAIVGSIIIFAAVLIAVFGRWLTPQNPYDLTQLNLMDAYLPPAWEEGSNPLYLLGTDIQGRCVLSSMVYGSASSLTGRTTHS